MFLRIPALQHYAVRTVENIAAQGGSWAATFADAQLVANLVSLWRGAKCDLSFQSAFAKASGHGAHLCLDMPCSCSCAIPNGFQVKSIEMQTSNDNLPPGTQERGGARGNGERAGATAAPLAAAAGGRGLQVRRPHAGRRCAML